MPLQLPIYMDNHSTTRVDPRVLEAMLPYFDEKYGNAGSTNHPFGWEAKESVDRARETIAATVGAQPREIVFTSGATESNNLAIRGVTESVGARGNQIVSVATEHKAVLDPLMHLGRRDFEITLLSVEQAGGPRAGLISPEQVADAISDKTALVSVMLANNEIGAIQPIAEIAAVCRERGVPLHCDATQAVGKIQVDVVQLGIDLMSFSAHKVYGPKGVGALFVRRQRPAVKLEPQIDGGGQEHGLRSGTLDVPGIVGFGKALEIAAAELPAEMNRLAALRSRLYAGLQERLSGVSLNGPVLEIPGPRLPGNLNLSFAYVDGEALLLNMRDLAVSSGSACTSANPEPSHVLRALGIDEDLVRASLRFGLGRFNTEEEVDFAILKVVETVSRLRQLSSLA
ncbi:MAG TPA: aminotransferase class V-fold PLP-dependent enzyme [Pirellulales bacterium]|jgi:cysteine desulfurase|nr:aminotransferase class V-fold PLP-dependent enzyme [Pirellulales bacterium]